MIKEILGVNVNFITRRGFYIGEFNLNGKRFMRKLDILNLAKKDRKKEMKKMEERAELTIRKERGEFKNNP